MTVITLMAVKIMPSNSHCVYAETRAFHMGQMTQSSPCWGPCGLHPSTELILGSQHLIALPISPASSGKPVSCGVMLSGLMTTMQQGK